MRRVYERTVESDNLVFKDLLQLSSEERAEILARHEFELAKMRRATMRKCAISFVTGAFLTIAGIILAVLVR